MKILKLRLKNLNSLAGEWSIDFSHPAFEQGGLMIITGPTGAGKTTILDAVCLALYGATPRLGKLTGTDNEIMTRGRAECLVELTFETPAGRYRCHWSQRRARNKAEGKLQPPQHEIVDDLTGRVLDKSLSKTLARVEKITGMNFDQFSRSVMLAQGAFAAFLEAPAKERASLLERITGTEIYGRLSTLAHERRDRENRALEALELELKGLVRPEEDEAALTAESARLGAALAELNRVLAEKRKSLDWRRAVAELEAAQAKLAAERLEWEGNWAEFQPDQERLNLAGKALTLAGEHGRLEEVRRQQGRSEADLLRRQRELPEAQATEARAVTAAAEAEARLAEARSAEEAARPNLIRARALDVEIQGLARRLAPAEGRLTALMAEIRELSRGKWPTSRDDLGRPDGWPAELRTGLEKMAADLAERRLRRTELLAGRDPAAWRDDLLAFSRRRERLEKLTEDLSQAEQKRRDLAATARNLEQTAADLRALGADLRLENERVAALELDGERLSTIWNLQREIRSLEDRRTDLVDGRPCPLCGALEHPFARPENLPPEQLGSADLEAHKTKLVAARRRANALAARDAGLSQVLKNGHESADKLQVEISGLESRLQAGTAELGLVLTAEEPLKALTALGRENQKQLDAADRTMKEAEKLEREAAAAEKRLQTGREVLDQTERLLGEALRLRADLEELSRQEADLRRDRAAVLGERDPEAEDRRLRSALATAQETLESRKNERQTAEKNREKLAASIADTSRELADLNELMRTQAAAFLAGAQAAGFADEAAWLAAALTEKERLELEGRFQSLSSTLAGLEARRQENQTRLAEVSALDLTSLTVPELEDEIEILTADSHSLLAGRGVAEQKLADLRRVSQAHARLWQAVEAQTRECRRWDELHRLIGSHDGYKYRNFAQGLTFEMLIRQANNQLAALSDRYLLQSDPARPLELCVLDNYQAGEIRPTKNLSGGESFLVSLALALGLAGMASRRVRVDTLFLDEGFGTLDEDTLDQALETLASLRAEGKLIGVISHIQALTERIPARILVRPDRGPFSRVSGPGVESVS